MAVCAYCGTDNPKNKNFCKNCGKVIPVSQGKSIKGTAKDFQDAASKFGGVFKKASSGTKQPEPPTKPTSAQEAKAQAATIQAAESDNTKSKSEVLRRVAKDASKAILKSVATSILVLGPGFIMLMMGIVIPGMIWLFLGSFGLMAWTYRKPWRLGMISCLMPPAAAAICYVIQLMLFGAASPPMLLLAGAIGAGIAVGYWRAQTHEVKQGDDGGIIAERTIQYLVVWVAAYGITQLLGFVAAGTFAVRAGLITGAFSTAMLAMVSVVIWRRFKSLRTTAMQILLASFIVGGNFFLPTSMEAAFAQSSDVQRVNAFFKSEIQRILAAKVSSGMPCQPTYYYGSENSFGQYVLAWAEFKCGGLIANNSELKGVHLKASVRGVNSPFLGSNPEYLQNSQTQAGDRLLGNKEISNNNYFGQLKTNVWQPKDYKSQTKYVAGLESKVRIESRNSYAFPSGNGFVEIEVTVEFLDRDYSNYSGMRVDSTPIAISIANEVFAVATSFFGAPQGDSGSNSGNVVIPPDRPERPISTEEAAAAAATIATVLIAAGIAVNVAQAIAIAIANAMQAGVQLTSEELQRAISEAMLDNLPGRGSGADTGTTETPGGNSNAPPNVQTTERVRPPTPIYDADGEPFETNEDGEYLAPDENGDWLWMSKSEAQEASAALKREQATREAEQSHHQSESERDKQRSRQKVREEDARTRREEQRQRDISNWWHNNEKYGAHGEGSYEDFDKRRREMEERLEAARQDAANGITPQERNRLNQLERAIGNAINGVGDGEDREQLLNQLTQYTENNDRQNLEDMWQRLRGLRQNQLVDDQAESRRLGKESDKAELQESAITFVRDRSKTVLSAGIAAATGGGSTFLQATTAVVIGGTGLATIGAAEEGFIAKDGDIEFDPQKATQGAVRGVIEAAGSAVSGVNAAGHRGIMAGKAVFSGVKTGAQTTSDINQKTGDWDLAVRQGIRTGFLDAGKSAAGEVFDEKARQARESGTFTSHDGKQKWQSLDDRSVAARATNEARMKAGKRAADILADTAINITSSDKDVSVQEAFGQALKTQVEGEIVGRVVGSAKTPSGTSEAQQRVIDRLNADRAGTAKRPGITPEYSDYLESKGQNNSDYTETGEPLKDGGGFTSQAGKHVQKVADSHGVKITVRTVDPEGSAAIEAGEAAPKRASMKANTGKQIDEALGMDPANRNRVVVFKPELPERQQAKHPDGTPMSDAEYEGLKRRHKLRMDQYNEYKDKLVDNDEYSLQGQLVLDKLQGNLPLAGDADVLQVVGLHDEPVSKATSDQVMSDLIHDPEKGKNVGSTVEHREHMAWDIASLDDTKIGKDGLTDKERAIGISDRVLGKIRPGGDPVAVFTGRPGMAPPRPHGAHYTGPGPKTE